MPGFTLVLNLGPSDGWWTSPVLYPSLMGISEPSDVQHASRMIMEVLWTHQCLNKKNKNKKNNNNNNNNSNSNSNGICVCVCYIALHHLIENINWIHPATQDVSQTRIVETYFGSGIPINLYIYCLYLPLWTWGGVRCNCLANIDFCVVSFCPGRSTQGRCRRVSEYFFVDWGGFRKPISSRCWSPSSCVGWTWDLVLNLDFEAHRSTEENMFHRKTQKHQMKCLRYKF